MAAFCDAAGYTKKRENLRDSSKLDPLIFSLFFYLLRRFDGFAIGLPLGCVVPGVAAVFLWKNERVSRCGAGFVVALLPLLESAGFTLFFV